MSDLTFVFTVPRPPTQTLAAINDVRSWWSGEVEGPTDALGAEWTYRVPGIHSSDFRVAELVPGRSVAWLVTDSWLSFTEDAEEWTGTTVRFDLDPTEDGGTQVRFTHVGLQPQVECYGVCRVAWSEYVLGSLKDLLESGAGRPDSFGEGKLEEARERAARLSG